jgi:hypothetical protein
MGYDTHNRTYKLSLPLLPKMRMYDPALLLRFTRLKSTNGVLDVPTEGD